MTKKTVTVEFFGTKTSQVINDVDEVHYFNTYIVLHKGLNKHIIPINSGIRTIYVIELEKELIKTNKSDKPHPLFKPDSSKKK